MSFVSLYDQIKCVEREIAMRERVYPRQVMTRRITQPRADRELEHMRAVKRTLDALFVSPGTFAEVSKIIERQDRGTAAVKTPAPQPPVFKPDANCTNHRHCIQRAACCFNCGSAEG